MKRKTGICPTCGKIIAVKIGVGPYADGRGDVMDHEVLGQWCRGGKAAERSAK